MEPHADRTGRRIADYAYAEDRELQTLHIPKGTREIGRHAFYNCRRLEEIHLPHGGIEIEDGAFKNCESLSHIFIGEGDKDLTCLRDILYDLNQEITVTISYGDDDRAVLLFPHYEYEYIANEPARIFSEVGYGAGYLYQQCFFDSRPDYPRYDSLWTRAKVSEEVSVLARILSYRLRFPHALSQEAEHNYLDYWRSNPNALLTYYIEAKDLESLRFFLSGRHKTALTISLALQIARAKEDPEIISFLLALTKKAAPQPGSVRKRFEL